MPGFKTHFLVLSAPLFGHARPCFTLALNLLTQYPDLYITFVATGTTSLYFSPSFDHEMTLYNLQEEPHSRLKIKLLGNGHLETTMDQVASLLTHFPDFLGSLLGSTVSDQSVDVFQHIPSLAIVDFAVMPARRIFDAVISACPNSLKIPLMSFVPTNAAMLNFYWFQTKNYLETYWAALSHETKQELEKVNDVGSDEAFINMAYKMWCQPKDIIVETVSLPPMYHYELNPQTDSLGTDPRSFVAAIPRLAMMIQEVQSKFAGFIVHTSPLMEPGEVEQAESSGQLILHIGPQYPQEWWDHGIPPESQVHSAEDQQVLNFLDDMQEKYGAHSLLYISFGTLFLPVGRPKLFDSLVKTLLAADPPLPFVFAGTDKISDSVLTKEHRDAIKKCSHGLLAGFVPQQALLKHTVTGWYLCHSGSNSISEAFLNGVPLILWPYAIDQPLIANQLSVRLKLAFELIQVRNGHSIGKPTYRGPIVVGTQEAVEEEMADIWSRMRGDEGRAMRQRVVEFSAAMKEDYRHGMARKAMNKFSDFMKA